MKQCNKLRARLAVLGVLTLTSSVANAEESTNAPGTMLSIARPFNPYTFGIELGTTGPGVKADWRFSDHFGVGAAFDYLPISYNGTIKDNPFNVDLKLMSEPLTLNLYPWKRHSFHFSAGILLNENHLTGSATGENINLNGNSYSGTLNLDIKQQVVDPYLSIGGNLYFDRAHHWSLGGELGVAYMGEPRVGLSLVSSAPLPDTYQQDLQAEKDQIQKYGRDAEFWPILKFSLNYSF